MENIHINSNTPCSDMVCIRRRRLTICRYNRNGVTHYTVLARRKHTPCRTRRKKSANTTPAAHPEANPAMREKYVHLYYIYRSSRPRAPKPRHPGFTSVSRPRHRFRRAGPFDSLPAPPIRSPALPEYTGYKKSKALRICFFAPLIL